MQSALAAAFHFIALGIGLGSLFMRGIYLRELVANPGDAKSLRRLFVADNLWGLAAVLWIVTGLLRAFAGLEKGSEFYLSSHLFWLKMGLFGVVFLLEIWPMTIFILWRVKKDPARVQKAPLRKLALINQIEVFFVLIIPLIASAMARGLG